MNFVVVGTDHRMQHSEAGFEGLLRGLLGRRHFEPLKAVAEEYHDALEQSVASRLATEFELAWYNLDLTTEEKISSGISNDQWSRPISTDTLAFRVRTDEMREAAWIQKLLARGSAEQTTLVICGYLHFDFIVRMLRAKGCAVDARVYLESVPEIRLVQE